ncbi:MAG: ATP phosphoribosyltransferase [Rhodobacteraceae bacterium]|nr:MAG: ATP phosphoribosyltransferase [Paracoccaceae bacterium]
MLKLGLPSKGRLQEQAVETLAAVGVTVGLAGREYAATAAGIEGVEPVLIAAGEAPRALAEGDVHLAVTGEDLILERVADPRRVRVLKRLGFGHADLVVAVPAAWVDVETLHDLDEAAAAFRLRHGRPMRVATKYHRLARRFFAEAGVADYRLVDSQGATEAGPKNLTAELIVDITSSGETLRANHLKPLADGLILASEAVLAVSRAAEWSSVARLALNDLGARMGFNAADAGL